MSTSSDYPNPITVMRAGRTIAKFVMDINNALAVPLPAVNNERISRLESADYVRKHRILPDGLAIFALYSGRPLADLYREYQAWVQSLADVPTKLGGDEAHLRRIITRFGQPGFQLPLMPFLR